MKRKNHHNFVIFRVKSKGSSDGNMQSWNLTTCHFLNFYYLYSCMNNYFKASIINRKI